MKNAAFPGLFRARSYSYSMVTFNACLEYEYLCVEYEQED